MRLYLLESPNLGHLDDSEVDYEFFKAEHRTLKKKKVRGDKVRALSEYLETLEEQLEKAEKVLKRYRRIIDNVKVKA
ncbi:MAG: hypothetical protein DRH08_09270 [Deltaproteobacteria bacterium]|nr:MAG: hypothetical protein DRH08_09270 [Deltaproteobacteria bacterium]